MINCLQAASAVVAESVVPAAGNKGAWTVTLAMPIYSVASLSFL